MSDVLNEYFKSLATRDRLSHAFLLCNTNYDVIKETLKKILFDYFFDKDIDIDNIIIQKEELSEVRWFSMDELKHMVATGELNEDQIACFNKVCN